jgi:acyl carrier protein
MIPTCFAVVDALPRNEHGKINRKQLAVLPVESAPPIDSGCDEEWTVDEREIAKLWKELLHIESVGLNDTFFALGGHSLLAIGMINRVQERFEVDVPIAAFMAEPTIAGCVNLIRRSRQIAESRIAETESIIAEVEKMPDYAVQELLRKKERTIL